jgi:glycosyltransferase involved in cell wall biosynthesis
MAPQHGGYLNAAVIIPARNEEAPLPGVLAGIPGAVVDQIIVVDNGSTDSTAEVARTAGASVVCEHQAGYGYACAAGIRVAVEGGAQVLVFLDADGSFDPSQIPDLIAPIEVGQPTWCWAHGLRGGWSRERCHSTPALATGWWRG